ncbi:competence type IV pilus minor pilin ComGD [Alteribacillus bidgolensis]|uniref:Competence protein ComGD n=1 Tax=Alteribacillus bidgolensis TaxID=930129 RepID=A0A1G8BLN5_9BACI|nr:competence type IV pilus minor pilin ComGD [Alteribacillus bidgolensis]SDH33974.1 competence protein ComGD [Alteribacillus bidgolensis]
MNKGHTLVEMLIVLLIITAAIGIPLLSFQSLKEKTSIDNFLEVLAADIRYAQQYAYANEKMVFFNMQNNYYYVRTMEMAAEPLKERKIPNEVIFEKGSLDLRDVTYNHNGNIKKAGTILIHTPKVKYRLVFLLGKGRFYIEER